MILDGNTDWTPDEVDPNAGAAVDPGTTVGIGPLPSRPTEPTLDPVDAEIETDAAANAPLFGSVTGSVDQDRPPMVTTPLPVDDASAATPHGWVATGPLSADDADVEPLPTGSIPVITSPSGGAASSVKLFLQAAVVLLAAGLVGLVVFGVLRSAAGDDSDGERADVDRSDGQSIDPGPGGSATSGDMIGSKRGTAGLGQEPDDESATGADDPTTDGSDRASGPVDPADSGPAGPTTVVERSGPPTTGGGRSGPTTRPGVDRPTSSIFSRVSTSSPSRPTTTRATIPSSRPTVRTTTTRATSTTATPTTIRPATTTTVASTTTTSLPASLIATPGQGSVGTWETSLALRANPVPGASQYCWTLAGTGGDVTSCRSTVSYGHGAASREPGPGPVTVKAEARASDGRVIMSQQVSITLLARDVVSAPTVGLSHDLGSQLRLTANRVPRAKRYCWTLTQGATSSGQLCGANRNRNLSSRDLSDFVAGPVTVRITAEQAGVVLGRQTVGFDFTGS